VDECKPLYGGTFSYPGDEKNPGGKLRLLYECFPMVRECSLTPC
jgi:fructose-1,6-bisphosphatase